MTAFSVQTKVSDEDIPVNNVKRQVLRSDIIKWLDLGRLV